jgi:hypothetical protein
MNREIISIDSACNGFEDAVKLTDKVGEKAGLTKKECLRLHLLSEELVGLLRGIAGDIKADYIVEEEDKKFTLHLKGQVNMDKKMHDQLIESSSKGENAAAKGFMGKMREMIGTMLLPGTLGNTFVSGFSMGLMNLGTPTSSVDALAGTSGYLWSMEKYVDSVKGSDNKEEWDALERSIVANIADEIKVSIIGNDVEIIIDKQF